MFRIQIDNLDNDAFAHGNLRAEIARILREVEREIDEDDRDDVSYPLKDANGNTIGGVSWLFPR